MRASVLLHFSTIVLLCCFPCRAQESSTINGNWLLTGSWNSPERRPWLTLSLGVVGDRVFAQGNFQLLCSNGVGAGVQPLLKGPIAADGTFLLTALSAKPPYTMTISGRMPGRESVQWSGNYNFTMATARGECSTTDSFVASKLPALRGIFSGTLQLTRTQLPDQPGEVTVTVDMTQAELVTFETPKGSLGKMPLQATIALSGSNKFPSEKLTSVKGSEIRGDHFNLIFSDNNGEQIMLNGSYIDAGEQQLNVLLARGANVSAAGILTRR